MLDKRAFMHCEWRTGKSVGRTIYAVTSETPHGDILIGMMDTPELANLVVTDHNGVRKLLSI